MWIESYDPTIEDSYRKQIEVDVGDGDLCVWSPDMFANVDQGRQCILEMYELSSSDESNDTDEPLDWTPLARNSSVSVHFRLLLPLA